jgi:hypothetical protein
VASGKWQVASGKWQVASGKWQVASGKWQVASGKWQVASGKWQAIRAKGVVLRASRQSRKREEDRRNAAPRAASRPGAGVEMTETHAKDEGEPCKWRTTHAMWSGIALTFFRSLPRM